MITFLMQKNLCSSCFYFFNHSGIILRIDERVMLGDLKCIMCSSLIGLLLHCHNIDMCAAVDYLCHKKANLKVITNTSICEVDLFIYLLDVLAALD